jgi:hypothetical protein
MVAGALCSGTLCLAEHGVVRCIVGIHAMYWSRVRIFLRQDFVMCVEHVREHMGSKAGSVPTMSKCPLNHFTCARLFPRLGVSAIFREVLMPVFGTEAGY